MELIDKLQMQDFEVNDRLIRFLSFYLVNNEIEFDWSLVVPIIAKDHIIKSVRLLISYLLKASYWERINVVIPDEIKLILDIKEAPRFIFEFDAENMQNKEYSERFNQFIDLVKTKQNSDTLIENLTFLSCDHSLIYNLVVQTFLSYGTKSLSHWQSMVEKYFK